ncbi:MAG: F0F1 ATP synthase subunit B [Planctomycetota bacterium]|nr:F0F1 ATP synthase subunit B [Planctomycetota bacterium]
MFHLPILLASEGGGFNPLDLNGIGGTFWTLVIFAIALLPIWKLVMGPVTRALEARDEAAAAGLAAAQKASEEAQNARAAVESKLRDAQVEASKILDAARGRAEVVERELKETAGREAQALLTRAKSEIKAEQDKALAAIRTQVVEVSMNAASQVLKRRVDSADDRRLVEEMVAGASSGTAPKGRTS